METGHTFDNVVEVDGDVRVSISSRLFVVEANGVHHFMDGRGFGFTTPANRYLLPAPLSAYVRVASAI